MKKQKGQQRERKGEKKKRSQSLYFIKTYFQYFFIQKLERNAKNLCLFYQQKGWKSVNFAHPFSSGVAFSGAAESHTLDPTSMATQGAGGFEFTGSNTAVHPDPAHTKQPAGTQLNFQNLQPS